MAGDIVSNAFYYSFLGVGKQRYIISKGLAYGALAGVGALTLTEPIGLNDTHVNRSEETEALIVAYYAFGGLISAVVTKALRS